MSFVYPIIFLLKFVFIRIRNRFEVVPQLNRSYSQVRCITIVQCKYFCVCRMEHSSATCNTHSRASASGSRAIMQQIGHCITSGTVASTSRAAFCIMHNRLVTHIIQLFVYLLTAARCFMPLIRSIDRLGLTVALANKDFSNC